jgi:hypothetical protein
MKNILEHIAEGIGILLVVLLYNRHRLINKHMSVEQDKSSENQ